MKTKQLGNSDLEVSVVGVGCMMFGSMCDQDTTTATDVVSMGLFLWLANVLVLS